MDPTTSSTPGVTCGSLHVHSEAHTSLNNTARRCARQHLPRLQGLCGPCEGNRQWHRSLMVYTGNIPREWQFAGGRCYVVHPSSRRDVESAQTADVEASSSLQCKTESELVAAIKTATSDKIDK